MKLVEILAKELSEWPESAVCITQDSGGTIYGWAQTGAEYRNFAWYSPDGEDFGMHDIGIEDPDKASDNKKSVVTRAQWQAERDRQKGAEWKRARGSKPKYETETPQRMEVRHRDGDVTKGWTSQSWNWSHNDGCPSADIMAWRIISQPQAEEVGVHKLIQDIGMHSHQGEIIHGPIGIGDEVIAPAHPKWQQSSGPLAWRDTIIHCQAIIEDCERDIQRNVDLLDAEGLMMQADSKKAMQYYAPDVIPSGEWKVGDIVEVISLDSFFDPGLRVGDQMPITHIDKINGTVKVASGAWGDEENYKFIRSA